MTKDGLKHSSTAQAVGVLVRATDLLDAGSEGQAADLVEAEYPMASAPEAKRQYTERQMMKVFLRDGFIDRYTGERLIHPGALRALAFDLPDAFPFHRNGKYGLGHQAFWDLFPSIDHIVPVARGGVDEPDNWLTSSMLTNARKANWLLEELQWELHPPGELSEWDGLSRWFVRWVDRNASRLDSAVESRGSYIRYLRRWKRATAATFEGLGGGGG